MADPVRLQKVLAAAGIGSRRGCERLIVDGRVAINGETVRALGTRVDATSAVITVDGLRVATEQAGLVHLALNKPVGMLSTMDDPEGRPSLGDVVGDRAVRLFHVGRLDTETEGLILLTNDGELAHRLTHPRYEVPKTYLAEVPGPVPRDVGRRLRAGVELDDGRAVVDRFRVVGDSPGKAMVEVVLHEGRRHIVRRMLDTVGLPVQRLVRVQVGPVYLGELRPGKVRVLRPAEVGALYAEVDL